jgi:hypothetical protein
MSPDTSDAAVTCADVVGPLVPDLLGADPGARVLVLEYLAEPGRRLAGDWMTDYAIALARLHAATGPGDADALPAWTRPGQADVRAFGALASRLDVPVPATLTGWLEELVERLKPIGAYALLMATPSSNRAECIRRAVRRSDC